MSISASMVKELRERTGAGMMECKKALVGADGDIELALEDLRKSGIAKAAKKAGRTAAEGVIAVGAEGGATTIAEINSETDFVAKDDNFLGFADSVTKTILAARPADVEGLLAATIAGGSDTVEDTRLQLVQKVGENIGVRRFEVLEPVAGNVVGVYLHGARIGVAVELKGGDEDLARDVAMHVAAANPRAVSEADLPAEEVAKEREIQIAQAEQSGKPADIAEKMVVGRIKKFIAEVTLTGQAFVKDPDTTVGQLLEKGGATCVRFVRFEVGEGIEKEVDNFADEVKAQAAAAAKNG